MPPQTITVRAAARWAGALNLASAVPAGFSVYVLQKVVVRGDAAATAANLLAREFLFRCGFVADLVGLLVFVVGAVFLYEVFRPAGRLAARLMLILMMVGAALQALECTQDLAALTLLKSAAGSGLSPAQASTLAFLFIRLHVYDYDLALLVFGGSCLLLSRLILRSRLVPRALGPLVAIEGLGYWTYALTTFLVPAFVARIYPYVPFATAFLGEVPLYLWLVVKGVDSNT